MGVFLKIITDILGIPELRRRVLTTFGLLAVYRVGFHIYLPGVDIEALGQAMQAQQDAGGLLSYVMMASLLTGGALSQATIFSLGIMPYISASIIFSLLVKVFPKLEAMQKEGEQGRRQINRYTRYATVGLCLVQGMFVVSWLRSPTGMGAGPISDGGFLMTLLQIGVLTSGTMFLMWLGEKITEYGIGNGISLIIMAGIIASMPGALGNMVMQAVEASPDERAFHVLKLFLLLLLFVSVVIAVVFITKGQRRIPVQQARSVKGRRVQGGGRSYMPIRVNSAGVLPIIFAQSLLMIPGIALQWLLGGDSSLARMLGQDGFLYPILYCGMIGFFTYFWTSLMFNPVEISDQMKEYGSFIPGIRPGRRTAEYLEQIISRITLTGAVFLSIIALIPQVVAQSFQVDFFISGFLGGTGILIVVGVALDLVDKVEAQLLVRHYEGFMRGDDQKTRGAGR